MTTRWWAPAGPHIGPDEKDFELLIPLDNARHDLGAALLALHRVGAAACEEVALHAIPDEVSLVQALASARQAFAAPLVESISKSVGEGPYAGLLVRDTIDDAEQAALVAFRTIVSKGVPATLAVQRVGMVYGVPESDLGSYLSVASELRVHPAALTDAADRVLFSAIEKISLEESVDPEVPFEDVSKTTPVDPPVRTRTQQPMVVRESQPMVVRDDPETDYYDGRDGAGRFARKAGPPEVGVAPTRATRASRATRATRGTRAKRPEAAAPERDRSRTRARTTGRDRVRLRRTMEPRTKAEDKEIIGNLDPITATGDFMQPIERPNTQGPFEQLDHDLAIAMSLEEWQEVRGKFGRDEDGVQAFRMGYLHEQRDVERFGYASDYEQDEHRKKLMWLAANEHFKFEQAHPYAKVVMPVTVTVTDDELASLEAPVDAQGYANGKKFDALVDHFRELDIDPYEPHVRDLITMIIKKHMRSNRSPDDKGDVFTYLPRLTGDNITADIKVVELVFEPGVRGRDEGHGKHTEYALDPNQVMRMEDFAPELIYDPKIEAFRMRYHFRPDVSKAYDKNEPRDASGQWTATATRKKGSLVLRDPGSMVIREEPAVEEASSTRASRSSRASRATRASRPIRAETFQPRNRERVRTRSASRVRTRVTMQTELQEIEQKKAHTHPKREKDSYREIFARGDYRVLSRAQMDEIEEHSEMRPGDDGIYVHDYDHKSLLHEHGVDGKLADFTMREMTDHQIMNTVDDVGITGGYLKALANPAKRLDPTSDDFVHQVHDHMENLFSKDPSLEQIQVFYDLDGQVSFLGNKHPLEPVVLIEVAEGFNPDQPFRMEYDTAISHDQLIPDFDEPIETQKQLMASLHYDMEDQHSDKLLPLKITRPMIDLYRLDNEPPETDERW